MATNTAFTTSPKKFSIDRKKFAPDFQLCDLANVLDGTRVIKVLRLENKAIGQSLQNVIIAEAKAVPSETSFSQILLKRYQFTVLHSQK